MACASQALVAANTYTFPTQKFLKKSQRVSYMNPLFTVRASSEDSDCNIEECAPDKEVGKISVEWLAGEKTKVVGTFPPKKRGWTGYVENDTAGQTNIYSIEPAVYVAESAISSGTAGTSADGADNTLAISGFLGLISVAVASSILLQVSKNPPPEIRTVEYSGPSLSYYINKFKPQEIIQASVPSEPESSAPEVTQIQVESEQFTPPSTVPSEPESSAPEVTQIQIESEQFTPPSAPSVS